MSSPVSTYIHDHIGGARVAIELLQAMKEHNDDAELRSFAADLLPEVHADERILYEMEERLGSGTSAIKEAGGWLMEKITRIKLGHTGSLGFETFESLELLVLGIQGKACLWKALQVAALSEPRLRHYCFEDLLARANQQYVTAERWRLQLAERVFTEDRYDPHRPTLMAQRDSGPDLKSYLPNSNSR